jgi:hypothetical protein
MVGPVVLWAYGAGLMISVLIGLGLWSMIKGRLAALLRSAFPDEEVWRFWHQLVGLSIVLATVSKGIDFSYHEKSMTDNLVLLWNFVDHIQGSLEGVLSVFLFAFVPLLFAYVLVIRRQTP